LPGIPTVVEVPSFTTATLDTYLMVKDMEERLNPKHGDSETWQDMNFYIVDDYEEVVTHNIPTDKLGTSYSTAVHDNGTDDIPFDGAFSYYRNKLGPGKIFVWQDHFYTTDRWTDSDELFEKEMLKFATNK